MEAAESFLLCSGRGKKKKLSSQHIKQGKADEGEGQGLETICIHRNADGFGRYLSTRIQQSTDTTVAFSHSSEERGKIYCRSLYGQKRDKLLKIRGIREADLAQHEELSHNGSLLWRSRLLCQVMAAIVPSRVWRFHDICHGSCISIWEVGSTRRGNLCNYWLR